MGGRDPMTTGSLFTALFLFAIVLAPFDSSAGAAEQGLPKSRVLLEQRVQELKEESRQKNAYRTDVIKLEEDLKQASQCVEGKSSVDVKPVRAAATALDASWRALVASPSSTVLDEGRKEYDAVKHALTSLEQATPTLTEC